MAFWDDLSEFGSGLLDDVGEGVGNIIDVATKGDSSKNSGVTQQPRPPVNDNYGNAVTGPARPAQGSDKTLLYVGGGVGVALLLTVVVVFASKK